MTNIDRSASPGFDKVAVTNVTMFTEDDAVDLDAIAAHVEFLVDSGVEILVPCGNTGEFSSLSLDEAKQIVSTTVGASGDLAAVVAGVGWSLPIAIELARHAAQAGAQAVMVHHPVHTYIDRQGLFDYYRRLLEAIELPVVLYKRGPELTDEVLAELARDDRVVAVKYAVNDVHRFSKLARTSDADVVWMCGTAERWAPFFHLAGAAGFTSGIANFAPRYALDLHNALRAGDFVRAMEVRDALTPLEDLREEAFSAKNVPVVKTAMYEQGLCDNVCVRAPLCQLAAEDVGRIRVQLDNLGLSPARAAAP